MSEDRHQELMDQLRQANADTDSVRALELSEKAVQEFPDSPQLLAIRANLLMWQGRRKEAQTLLGRAIEIDPECAMAWAASASFDAFEARFDVAAESVNKALSLDANDYWVLHWSSDVYSASGDQDRSLDLANRMCEVYPDDEPALTQKATTLLATGRADEVQTVLAEIERQFPDSPRALQLRARILMRGGEIKEALGLLTRVSEKCPNSQMAWAELASALSFMKREKEAEAAAKRALEICPISILAMNVLARICAEHGQHVEAAEWQQRAANAIPALRLQMSLSSATAAMRQGDWEAVLRISEPVVNAPAAVTRASAFSHRVSAFLELGRIDEAEGALIELEKIDSSRMEIHELRARILQARGQVFDAAAVLRKGIERHPTDGGMRAHLLEVLHSMNAGQEQDDLVRDLMENPPDSIGGIMPAYMALSDTGHEAEADEFLRHAKETFPNASELLMFEAVRKLQMGDLAGARAATKNLTGDWAKIGKKVRMASWFMTIMSKAFFFLRKPKPGG